MKFDWSHADFAIANSTCFDADLMQLITDLSRKMKVGSWFVTLTKKLTQYENSKDWELVLSIKRTMSWGQATVNIHKKIA